MNKFLLNHSEKLTGYLLILPAVLIISLFGIFPVFFGMYMSVHKWKVFKGRFLGFENYQRILGDIPAFWLFVLGLLLFPSPDFSKSILVGYLIPKELFPQFVNQSLLFISFIVATFIPIFAWKFGKK